MSEGHDPHHLVDEHMLCRVGPETTLSTMMAISPLYSVLKNSWHPVVFEKTRRKRQESADRVSHGACYGVLVTTVKCVVLGRV